MRKIKIFLTTTLLGGIVVILPTAVIYIVFRWIFDFITRHIQPLTDLVVRTAKLKEVLAGSIVVFIILIICFLVGVLVKTKLGAWIYRNVENRLLKIFPGYSLIKETIAQLVGAKKSPFSSVALVKPFGNDTLAIGFITATHPDGSYTVFLPTAPNPTSGYIIFLQKDKVHRVDLPTEAAMKTIISCGMGSNVILEAFLKEKASREKGGA
jgi:uncharacterized membrane protein